MLWKGRANNDRTGTEGQKPLTKTLGNYSFILIFAVILIAHLIISSGATTLSGVMNILRHSAVVGIRAFGMGLVIITGGIDLSVGSMLAMNGSVDPATIGQGNEMYAIAAVVIGGISMSGGRGKLHRAAG